MVVVGLLESFDALLEVSKDAEVLTEESTGGAEGGDDDLLVVDAGLLLRQVALLRGSL